VEPSAQKHTQVCADLVQQAGVTGSIACQRTLPGCTQMVFESF